MLFDGTLDNDTLYGTVDDDTLNGLDGNDILYGEMGDDVALGDAGDDQLYGGWGNDSLSGGTGLDRLYGEDGDDVLDDVAGGGVLDGGGGNDSLTGGTGRDTLLGGDDDDWLSGSDGNDSLSDGLAFNPSSAGDPGDDTLFGGSGDDILSSLSGSDSIDGGSGIDALLLNRSHVTVGLWLDLSQAATLLADGTWIGNVELAELRAGAGNDRLTGGQYADRFYGGSGADTGQGNDGADYLSGEGGHDELWGGAGNDRIEGDAGNDLIAGGLGNDSLRGGSGVDTVSFADAAAAVTVNLSLTTGQASGGAGNDTLSLFENVTGSGFADQLAGDGGNNVLDGGAGVDTLIGGLGDDTYYVDATGDRTVELSGQGTELVMASASYSLVGQHVEHLTLTGSSDLTATGNGGNNQITGNSGNNVLDGGLGTDVLSGGLGNDTYYVQADTDKVVEAAGQGIDLVFSTVTYSLAGQAIEGLTLSGAADINATGNGLANSLTGNAGHNRLDGDVGNDTLTGGLGNDTYVVQTADDVIVEANNAGIDVVLAYYSYTLGALSIEKLVLGGTDNLNATGSTRNDDIAGNDGNNILDGGLGADTVSGRLGDDTYYVDATGDIIIEAADGGDDTVISQISYSLLGLRVEELRLVGAANLNATGSEWDNRLYGNDGNNLLSGGNGKDVLDGGGGTDTLNGGEYDDTYYVHSLDDIVIEQGTTLDDLVISDITYTLGAGLDDLTLTGSGDLNGTGNASYNVLTGNSGINRLAGGGGHDTYYVQNEGDVVYEQSNSGSDVVYSTVSYAISDYVERIELLGTADLNATGNQFRNVLRGNSGTNILTGGLDDDTYYIQNTSDVVVELAVANGGSDTIVSSVSYSLVGTHVERLELLGNLNLSVTGNEFSNQLQGNSGSNLLNGGAGNDGLRGNASADVFMFDLGSGLDVIWDFNVAQNDVINIHAYTAGVANADMVSQNGSSTIIDLGGGNSITVAGTNYIDVLTHIVW